MTGIRRQLRPKEEKKKGAHGRGLPFPGTATRPRR